MKVRQMVVVLAMAVVGLTGCQREGEDVTGSYSGRVLTGAVVLSGIDGSPEGVEVTVRDTGMTATLGADGRFAFAGVPEDAILDFRRGDGIHASLTVNGKGKESVVVELGRSGVTRSKPGRGNSGKDKRELEGVIRTASATRLVLVTSRQEEVTVALNGETVIRKGNQTLTAADLKAGMRVHVQARKVDDSYTALRVTVQEPTDTVEAKVSGEVVSVSGSSIVVRTKSGQVTVQTDASTRIRRQGKTIAIADIAAGDTVSAKGRKVSENMILATEVEVRGKSGRP